MFLGPGTKERLEETPEQNAERVQKLAGAVKTILECVGEDPEREGLLGTPERYAKAMLWFTKGYMENVRDLVNNATFMEDHDELVIVKDIEVFSLCEHHMVPFTGKVGFQLVLQNWVIAASKLTYTDSYRLHPRSPSARSLEISSSGRNVFPPLASTRTSHETNRLGHQGGVESQRCRSGHGIFASLHGDARCPKDHQHNHNKLYARLHADQCQNPRGVLDTSQPQISTTAALMNLS